MKSKHILAATVAAVAIGAGGVVLTRLPAQSAPASAAPSPMPALPVPVTDVLIKSLPVRLSYPARIEAIKELSLQAKATGFLLEQSAQDGASVRAGDLLYRIDQRDIRARLDQVRAQLDRDTANLDYLRSNYDRGSQLAKIGALAKDTFDQRMSAVKQAEAALAIDQAAIRAAELNLADTDIRAPFDGQLGRNRAAIGTYVSAGATALNTLVQLSPIFVTFNPTEQDLARIQAARKNGDVTVDVSAQSGAEQSGKLVFLDNALDRTTGTITARGIIENADAALLPGQYVRVKVTIGRIDDAKLVPLAAVGSSQLGKYVYTVGDKNVVEMKQIALGQSDGDHVAVTSGLSGSETIITGNLQKIGPGAPVSPLRP